MGNMCATNIEEDDISYRSSQVANNYIVAQAILSKITTVQIIYGTAPFIQATSISTMPPLFSVSAPTRQ